MKSVNKYIKKWYPQVIIKIKKGKKNNAKKYRTKREYGRNRYISFP